MSSVSSWVRNRSDEAAVDQGCWFDLAAADRVRYFFERFLRHSKGEFAGRKFELLDWQWDRLVAPAFGWRMPDGTRRFRRIGCGVPKKNGKSTLLSGVGLYLTLADGEPGAEVYTAAADRKQASIIFNEAANMVEASDALRRVMRVKRSSKTMWHRASQSTFEALSADVPTKEGFNIHGLLFDELHAQRTWDLWNTLKYGGASRRQPMLWWISTAGVVDLTSLWHTEWQRAKAIQDSRVVDISYLGVVYEADQSDDPYDEAVWAKVNPSYGVTISRRGMEEAATEARVSGLHENTFKRYRLNMPTKQTARWLPMDKWDLCATTWDDEELRGAKCYLGLDLASTSDLAAAVLLFRHGLKWRLLPKFWVPREALRTRELDNRTRLDHWVDEGWIQVTEGDVIDYQVIRRAVNDLADLYDVREVAIDPWNATQIAVDLTGDGHRVEYVRTGFASISAASKEFEKLVRGQQLEHPANPVLDWMVGNVAAEEDASGNIKPSKRRSGEKIDGVVASVIALARAIRDATKSSKYEAKGLDTL